MARTIGIWIFGLLAAGIAGAMIGISLIPDSGWPGSGFFGFFGGMFAFSCVRLWLGGSAKSTAEAARK